MIKRRESSGPGAATGSTDMVAFIGQGARFNGTLTYDGIVRVEGTLEGEVTSNGHLIVGPSGVVKADIRVNTISVSGTVVGSIRAKRFVEIHASGKVYGEIHTPSLVIEEGVIFQGSCHMDSVSRRIPLKEVEVEVPALAPIRAHTALGPRSP